MDKIVTKEALKDLTHSISEHLERMTLLDAVNLYLESSDAYNNEYFGIILLEEVDSFVIQLNGNNENTYEIRKNYEEWVTVKGDSQFISYNCVIGDIFEMRFVGGDYTLISGNNILKLSTSRKFSVFGNISSLRGYQSRDRQYASLFENNINLISAKYLKLEPLKYRQEAYAKTFYNCRYLIETPELPKLDYIEFKYYDNMFTNCKSLIYPPTTIYGTIGMWACQGMFDGCTSLIEMPNIETNTIEERGCAYMFSGCTSLKKAKDLRASNIAPYCYKSMFENCTELEIAPKLSAVELYNDCYSAMFKGCSNLQIAPDLTASEVPTNAYYQMFMGCTKLNYIKCLMTNPCQSNNTYQWTLNVENDGIFVKDQNVEWPEVGSSSIPEGWQVEDLIEISMYIDDFPDGIWEDDGYDNFDDYFNDYYSVDYDESGANKLTYTGETLEYEGVTYFVWRGTNDSCIDAFVLTNTVSYSELYPESIEADHSNRVCPIYAWFNSDDNDPYIANYDDDSYVLVAVRQ